MIFASRSAFVLLFALSACTNELTVQPMRLDEGASPINQPVKGIPYYLPATALDISVTHTITKCTALPGELELDVSAATEVKPVRVPDRSAAFVIDYTSLQAAMKHSKIQVVRNPDGTLSSINATSEDLTGDPLVALVKTAAASVGFAAAPTPVALDERTAVARTACKAMNEAIREREKTARELSKVEKAIVDLRGAKPELTDADKERINALTGQANALKRKLVPLVAATSLKLEKRVLPKSAVTAPSPNGYCAGTGETPLDLEPEALRFLAFDSAVARQQAGEALRACLRIAPTHPARPVPDVTALGTHLVYREPAPAEVEIGCNRCKIQGAADTRLLFRDRVEMAQFGVHYVLPFRNRAFDDNALTAKFDNLGLLKEATYENEAALKAAALSAQQVAETLETRAKGRLAEEVAAAQAQNALLEAEINRLELEAKLEATRAATAGN